MVYMVLVQSLRLMGHQMMLRQDEFEAVLLAVVEPSNNTKLVQKVGLCTIPSLHRRYFTSERMLFFL